MGIAHSVRPTLVVAVGGTGARAAECAKAEIRRLTGKDYHFVAFRVFDTDRKGSDLSNLVDKAEFIDIGNFPAASVIADIYSGKHFSHWRQWFPERLTSQQVFLGAGGVRPVGRLSYFYRRDRIREAIEVALGTITNSTKRDELHRRGGPLVEIESGIDIHLIGSLCGGTGAGIFLDLAYDLRRWAQTYREGGVTMTGHLVLPEAFKSKPVVMRALEANCYVALQELDRYMNATPNDRWCPQYLQGKPECSDGAPFDFCYVLSGEHRSGTIDVETLAATIGEFVTLSTICEAGHNAATGLRNALSQRLTTQDNKGRACCYSSYGVVALEIPSELLRDILRVRVAEEAKRKLLGETSQDALGAARNRANELAAFLQPDEIGRKPEIENLEPVFNWFGEGQPARAANELKQQQTGAQQAWDRTSEDARGRIAWPNPKFEESVHSEVKELLRREEGGLRLVQAYLETCESALDRQLREFDRQSGSVQANTSDSPPAATREWTEADVRPAYEKWQNELQQQERRRTFRVYRDLAKGYLRDFHRRFVECWATLARFFKEAKFPPPMSDYEYSVKSRPRRMVCDKDFIAANVGKMRDLTAEVLNELADTVSEWEAADHDHKIEQHLTALCASVVSKLPWDSLKLSCDELLWNYYLESPEQYLERVSVLHGDAGPLWESHHGYALRDNAQEIACVGATEHSHIFLTLRLRDPYLQCTSNERPDFLPIIRTEHGLSLIGLKRLEDYRDSFEASVLQEQRWDVHFFLDQSWACEMEFADFNEITLGLYQAFSIADLSGIMSGGKQQVYRWHEDGTLLGSYRREAFERVRSDPALVTKFHATFAQFTTLKDAEVEAWKRAQPTDRPVNEMDSPWHKTLRDWIADLQRRVKDELDREPNGHTLRSEVKLKQDVFQVHNEIRALRELLKSVDRGL
jgi:hypothetical protein